MAVVEVLRGLHFWGRVERRKVDQAQVYLGIVVEIVLAAFTNQRGVLESARVVGVFPIAVLSLLSVPTTTVVVSLIFPFPSVVRLRRAFAGIVFASIIPYEQTAQIWYVST